MTVTANYIDIFNRRIFPAAVTVDNGRIASVTAVDEVCSTYILPGFIDAHIHVESSMLVPSEFARLAVRHGTVATVSDPHEIANVLGVKGVEYMLENAAKVPFRFHFGASPCVPATPFETSGAVLGVDEIGTLLKKEGINHLSEVMAFPSVIAGDEEILAKIEAAKEAGVPVDGHAPGLRGDDLQTYIDAGITTDHEAGSYEEAKEKLERGMKILIREGSAAKNYEALSPLIGEYPDVLMFCSDDRHPNDLLKEHIDALVRRSVAKGYDLFDVLRIACVNPVEHYRLDVGLLRTGDRADFIEVKELESFEVLRTVIGGEEVFAEGRTLIARSRVEAVNHFDAQCLDASDLAFEAVCDEIEVIEAIDHALITQEKQFHLPQKGEFHADLSRDILKIAVLNRYEAGVKPAVAFVRGFGLKKGAIASSVAHDSHNVIIVGCDDASMAKAANALIESKGGVAATDGERVVHLPLEVAGIMSSGDAFEVAEAYEKVDRFAKEALGSPLSAPFMTLSFMALLVIPELKLSDRGLFDGRAFHFVPVCSR